MDGLTRNGSIGYVFCLGVVSMIFPFAKNNLLDEGCRLYLFVNIRINI